MTSNWHEVMQQAMKASHWAAAFFFVSFFIIFNFVVADLITATGQLMIPHISVKYERNIYVVG